MCIFIADLFILIHDRFLRSLCIQRPSCFSLQNGPNLCGRCMGCFQGGEFCGVQGHSIHHYICRSCCSCSTAALGNSYMQSNTGYCIGYFTGINSWFWRGGGDSHMLHYCSGVAVGVPDCSIWEAGKVFSAFFTVCCYGNPSILFIRLPVLIFWRASNTKRTL